DVVTLAREDVPGDKRLVAYLVARSGQHLDPSELRSFLQQRLPEYMVPSALVSLESLPLTSNGKVDRKALPAPDADSTGRASHFVEPSSPLEQQLVALWSRVLGAERIGVHDHFFQELGGTSLSAVKVVTRMREELQREIPVTWLFEHSTIHALARRLAPEAPPAPAHRDQPPQARAQGRRQFHERREGGEDTQGKAGQGLAESGAGDIAIIGMSGRFPGARSVEAFWHNLRQGLESISRFAPEEVERMPRLPEGMDLRQHPQFVPAGGVLEAIERFDHAFFDIPLREAQWMDPQQRLFLQCAWAALEDAGYVPERTEAPISLYAGAGDSGYLQTVMRTVQQHDPATLFDVAGTTTHTSLATKVSFKLGLTGESLMVQTACSTGLVAVHMACKSLLTGESDMALAGAARIEVPQRTGYVYQEGMIASPDGHCRAFDARAQGTVGGNGVIVVALKRLAEAVRDGDHVYAVIKGSAINNDGRIKSGFTAPSVQGQATVIQKALASAGLKPTDIGYVEAHGTGTRLG
ncbi:MAG: beta-ketoacyl synthase N-terminal-like domain-containing protein, partial [Archangium sp.]